MPDLLFPDRGSASLTLAFHARAAWCHRVSVREALERGNDTCCFCSTRIPAWMEVHHLNGIHDDWRTENLVPICHFCHLAQHPAQPGFARRDFPLEILWWPELTQPAIMAFAWSVAWLGACAAQREELAATIGDHLKAVRTELSRRAQHGRAAAGTALPADLLAAAGEEEPQHWRNLRFFPVEVRSTGQHSAVVHRWLAGGPDSFPLSSVTGNAVRKGELCVLQ